jgi:hypothetical protein
VSKKANKVIKNKDVNDSFCKLEVLALNVCGLVSKLRNPDFREFISLYIKQACKSLSSSVFSMSLNISILLYILLSGGM